jgi:hypothetical protein
MKQFIFTLELAFKIAGIFLVDFIKEQRRELVDKTLYPQPNYKNCVERATAILMKAMERAIKYYACAIAYHRFHDHSEDHSEEITELESGLSGKDFKSATRTRGWWMT